MPNSQPVDSSVINDIADITDNFDHFNPRSYLSEYHEDWDDEDVFHMTFLHHVYQSLPMHSTMLEIGGGPTIYQLISARNKTESIVFTDYLTANRNEIRMWKHGAKNAFNWDIYFEFVSALEQQDEPIASMKQTLRKKMRHIVSCNILQEEQRKLLAPIQQFDLVSVHFCPESITSRREDFVRAMRNICSFIKPGGTLLMTFLRTAELYVVGSVRFSCYPIEEVEAQKILLDLGCETTLVVSGPAEDRRDYNGTFSLLAKKMN